MKFSFALLQRYSINETYLIFGYNTLKNPKTRSEIWGKELEATPYTLKNYKRISEPNDFDTLQAAESESTKGVIIELSKEQLDILDKWEKKYERKKVATIDGEPVYAYFLIKENE